MQTYIVFHEKYVLIKVDIFSIWSYWSSPSFKIEDLRVESRE